MIKIIPIIIWGIVIVNLFEEDDYIYMFASISIFYFFWSNTVAYFTGGDMANMTHYYEADGDEDTQAGRKWFAGFCMILFPLFIFECLYYAGIFD